jgi:hypothetical protein
MTDSEENERKHLGSLVEQFCTLDAEIGNLNKVVYERREQRKYVSELISDYVRSPKYNVNEIKTKSGAHIKIQKPYEHSGSVSFTKSNLENDILEYFNSVKQPNGEQCVEYVFARAKERSISTNYDFVRVVPKQNVNNN